MTSINERKIYMTLELQIEMLEDKISDMTKIHGEGSDIVKALKEDLEELEAL